MLGPRTYRSLQLAAACCSLLQLAFDAAQMSAALDSWQEPHRSLDRPVPNQPPMGKSAHVANASGQTARVYVRTGGVNRNFCLNPGDVQKVQSKERAYFAVTINGMTQQME